MKQQLSVTQINRKHTEPKAVQRDRYNKNQYWVQSETHRQLSYRVILTDDEVYCACKGFKFGKGTLCKHLMKLLKIQVGVSV